MAKRFKKKNVLVGEAPPKVGSYGQRSRSPEEGLGWWNFLQALLILAAGGWIYGPVLHGGWLMDDNLYVTRNPLLLEPDRLWKAWFVPGSFTEYYPIEQSLQWMQWLAWRGETFGYHVTNLVLHLGSALLVWRLLSQFGLRLAWLGGLIFAVHPTMVESVAWIAEFKNTLSLPPFLLAMIFYLGFEESGKSRDYFLALGFFVVAMLCKISMASFPFVILLYAWWKRGRIGWTDLRATVPFFFVSLVLGLLSTYSGIWFSEQHHTPPDQVPLGGFFSRMALAGLSIGFYFWNCVWPVGLLPIYPQWPVNPPSLLQFLPWPILAAMLYGLWTQRKSWGRHALLGLGFFLILLGPFVTINVGGYTAFTWVMDHFLYIPIIGLIGLAVAGLELIGERIPQGKRRYGACFLAVVLGLLTWESHNYASMFVNQETLWTHTLPRNPDAWVAHNNLGNALQRKGQLTEAIEQYDDTLRLNPSLAETHFNLANALLALGRISEANQHYEQAAQLNPYFAEAQQNCGITLIKMGRPAEAIEYLKAALQNNPAYVAAQNNWGVALVDLGRAPEALEHFALAIQLKPDYPEAYYNWGMALIRMKQFPEAVQKFERALQLKPDYTDVREDWGNLLLDQGQFAGALDQFQAVLALKPDDVVAHFNCGNTLVRAGRPAEALVHYQEVQRLDPAFADAYTNMGAALTLLGRNAEAIQEFQEALRHDPGNMAARNDLKKLNAKAAISTHK